MGIASAFRKFRTVCENRTFISAETQIIACVIDADCIFSHNHPLITYCTRSYLTDRWLLRFERLWLAHSHHDRESDSMGATKKYYFLLKLSVQNTTTFSRKVFYVANSTSLCLLWNMQLIFFFQFLLQLHLVVFNSRASSISKYLRQFQFDNLTLVCLVNTIFKLVFTLVVVLVVVASSSKSHFCPWLLVFWFKLFISFGAFCTTTLVVRTIFPFVYGPMFRDYE